MPGSRRRGGGRWGGARRGGERYANLISCLSRPFGVAFSAFLCMRSNAAATSFFCITIQVFFFLLLWSISVGLTLSERCIVLPNSSPQRLCVVGNLITLHLLD